MKLKIKVFQIRNDDVTDTNVYVKEKCVKKIGWTGEIKQKVFRLNVIMFSADLMLSGSVFHRVGAVTEKVRVPAFVLTLGTASKF